MLVTSIFSFSHNIFKRLLTLFLLFPQCFLTIQTTPSVNPFQNKPWFLHASSTSLLKTLWEKEKLLVTSNLSFSRCFLPFGELSAIYIKFKIVVCKLFQFFIWERVKHHINCHLQCFLL